MWSVLQGNHRNAKRRLATSPSSTASLAGAVGSVLETLEDRWLLSAGSATLTNGLLNITGASQGTNQINIDIETNDATKLDVTINGATSTFNVAAVKQIVAKGGPGANNIVTQDDDVSIMIPMAIYGGEGANYLVGGDGADTIFGGAGADKIIGGLTKNKIDGEGGGDLINTRGGTSVVARHRGQQQVNAGNAGLGVVSKHVRVPNVSLKNTVKPIDAVVGPEANGAYTPAQIKQAYGLSQLTPTNPLQSQNEQFPDYTNTGVGQTIVIVGGFVSKFFDNPTLPGDLQAFEGAFGLPLANIQYVVAPGQTRPVQPDQEAAEESALDIEWAHAIAPDAQIVMVQVDASNGSFFSSDLLQGIEDAANIANEDGGGVVSMSFGTTSEDPTFAAELDSVFGAKSYRDVSFVASSGDTAGDLSDPATSPYVTAVGGTTTQLDTSGNIFYQSAWLDGGGGVSAIEPIPSYQKGITINGKAIGTKRAVPDVSLIADSLFGAVQIYTGRTALIASMDIGVDGTSVGAPIFAGMVADANELRATEDLGVIGSQLNPMIYTAYKQNSYGTTTTVTSTTGNNVTTGNFVDVIAGNNTHQAYVGYDLATGLGSPQAQNLIPALGGNQVDGTTVKLTGQVISALASGGISGSGVTAVSDTGVATIGPQKVTLTFAVPATDPTNGSIILSAAGGPLIITFDRSLTNSIFGQTQVQIEQFVTTTDPTTGLSTTTTSTVNFFVQISGSVTTNSTGQEHVSGTIVTIDPNTGKPLHQGNNEVFQATFKG